MRALIEDCLAAIVLIVALIVIAGRGCAPAHAQEPIIEAPGQDRPKSKSPDAPEFPAAVRQWYLNTTNPGSCVQCSLGMCGVWQNCPAASTLLWPTEYGPAVLHGSGPARVSAYCDARGIPAYNVTGELTWEWMRWVAATGRMAAIGADTRHFQTLVWFDAETQRWHVCNNNSPWRIDAYTESQFRALHLASGRWLVVLKTPPPPAKPEYDEWWHD